MLHNITEQPPKRLSYIPGQYIVKVEEPAVRPHVGMGRSIMADAANLPDAVTEPLGYLARNAGLKAVTPLFSTRRTAVMRRKTTGRAQHAEAVASSVADSESEEVSGINVIQLDPKKASSKLLKHVNAAKAVQYLEPMPARWAAASANPKSNVQWGLRAIDWFGATRRSAKSITVAVVDSGIDVRHPDLRGASVTYDHTGTRATDVIGHGTHVAGIIAAVPNAEVGITGVANARLAVWKVFPDEPWDDGQFYVDGERYLQALQAVSAAGIRIVNLSLGGTESSQTEVILFRQLQRAGVLVVAAMGNEYEDGNPVEYPAAYEGVLSVGSVDETRTRSVFSNTGPHIDICAPGSNVISTVPVRASAYRDEVRYAVWSGTSMATPHVAGTAALVAARHPGFTAEEIKQHLIQTAKRVPAMGNQQRNNSYGAGLLNVRAAVT